MRITTTLLLLFSFLLFNCSSDDNSKKVIEIKKPVLEFKNKEVKLLIEDKVTLSFKTKEIQLTAQDTINPFDQLIVHNNVNLSDIEWSISNNDVVALTREMAEAKTNGEAVITAKIKNTNERATLKIIVSEIKISFTKKELYLDMRQTPVIDLSTLL